MSYVTTGDYFSVEGVENKVLYSQTEYDSLIPLAPRSSLEKKYTVKLNTITSSKVLALMEEDFNKWSTLRSNYKKQIKACVQKIATLHDEKEDLATFRQFYLLLVTLRKIYSKLVESYQKTVVGVANNSTTNENMMIIATMEQQLVDMAHDLDYLNEEPLRSLFHLGINTTLNPFLLTRHIDGSSAIHQENLSDNRLYNGFMREDPSAPAIPTIRKELALSPSDAQFFQSLNKVVYDVLKRVEQRNQQLRKDELKRQENLKWQEEKDRQLSAAVEKGLMESKMIGQRLFLQHQNNDFEVQPSSPSPYSPSSSPDLKNFATDAFDFSPSPDKRKNQKGSLTSSRNAFSPTYQPANANTKKLPPIQKPKPFLSPKKEERRFVSHFRIDKKADDSKASNLGLKGSRLSESEAEGGLHVDPGMTKRLFWLRWKKCYYTFSKLTEYRKGLMYRRKRTVLDLIQKYAWQSMQMRRMQYNYYLRLMDTAFSAWQSYRRWCRRFNTLHFRAQKRRVKRCLMAWRFFARTVFDYRNFKKKYWKILPQRLGFDGIYHSVLLQRHFIKQRLKNQTTATFCDKITRKQCFDRWAARCRFVWKVDRLDELIESYLLKNAIIHWCLATWR